MLSPYPAGFPYPDRSALVGDIARCLTGFLAVAGLMLCWAAWGARIAYEFRWWRWFLSGPSRGGFVFRADSSRSWGLAQDCWEKREPAFRGKYIKHGKACPHCEALLKESRIKCR